METQRTNWRIGGNANMTIVAFLVVFATIFIGGAWYLTELGPGNSGRSTRKSSEASPQLQGHLASLLASKAQLESWQTDGAANFDPMQVQQLRDALNLTDAILAEKIHLNNDELARTEALADLVSELLSRHLQRESVRQEESADRLLESGQPAEGLAFLEQALAQQAEINGSFPASEAADRKRVFLLERKIREQQAEPLFQESATAEQTGDEALAAGRAEEARAQFQVAFAKQATLNENHPNSRRRDPLRLHSLQSKIANAESYEQIMQQESRLGQARALASKDKNLEAAQIFQQTATGFASLVKEKPELEPLLQQRIDSAVQSSTESAVQYFQNHFANQLIRLDGHLVSGQMSAAVALEGNLRNQLVEMERRFPGTSNEFSAEAERLHFLDARKELAAAQQQYLRQQFVAIPGHAGWWMLRTEVSQELYTAIMDVPNPSRNKGGNLPVESVSHADAVVFATRASWLLGVNAQLPSRDQFLAVAGQPESPAQIPLQSSTGTIPAGNGTSNPKGFLHLWGNVSEWLAGQEDADSERVLHAGGNFSDSQAQIFHEPFRSASVNDRSRLVGFRVVIHIPQK